MLRTVAATREKRVLDDAGKPRTVTARVGPRTVNQHRQLMCAIFNYATRPSTYELAANPAKFADRRREPERGRLAFYTRHATVALLLAPILSRRTTSGTWDPHLRIWRQP